MLYVFIHSTCTQIDWTLYAFWLRIQILIGITRFHWRCIAAILVRLQLELFLAQVSDLLVVAVVNEPLLLADSVRGLLHLRSFKNGLTAADLVWLDVFDIYIFMRLLLCLVLVLWKMVDTILSWWGLS